MIYPSKGEEFPKYLRTFATNSNDYDTNYKHSFQLSHLRESGLPESFPLFASNSVCSPTQTRAQSTTNQPGLLRTGRLLPVLSELRTCALCLWLRSLPRRDAPQTVWQILRYTAWSLWTHGFLWSPPRRQTAIAQWTRACATGSSHSGCRSTVAVFPLRRANRLVLLNNRFTILSSMRTVRRRTDWSSLLKELWFVTGRTGVRCRKNCGSLPKNLASFADEQIFQNDNSAY